MDQTAQQVTTYILTFAGGVVGLEIFRTLRDWITGTMRRRRDEVDRIAREKADADTWTRIITEHAHEVRVIAIKAGLDVPDFPTRPAPRSPSGAST